MTWSIPLGPLVLPAQFLLLCLSAGLGLWLGERRARRAGGSVERELQGALLAAGMRVHLIGGADVATELDAKRAIKQATELAVAA